MDDYSSLLMGSGFSLIAFIATLIYMRLKSGRERAAASQESAAGEAGHIMKGTTAGRASSGAVPFAGEPAKAGRHFQG